MSETILKVKNLNKKFYSKNGIVNAVDNVSFELKKGKVLGLVGESGSGKTTIGRTIMNLHNADSGIIEIDGKKYTGKLNKKQRKELYRNVQMIFQDPYSSLNGQKNIKAILQESLLVKGMAKDLLTAFTVDREEVFQFFGASFAEFFWKGYWEYRNYANKTAVEYYRKIQNDLKKVKIDIDKDIVGEWNKIDEAVFENKKEANTLILLKLNSFLDSLFTRWRELQIKVSNGLFEDMDEKQVFDAKNKLAEIQKMIDHSEEYYISVKEREYIQAKKEKYLESIESLKVYYKEDLRTKKKDLRRIISSDKADIRYSEDLKSYKSLKLGLYLDKVIYKVLQSKELRFENQYLLFDKLFMKLEQRIYNDNNSYYEDIANGVEITEKEVLESNDIQKYINIITNRADEVSKEDAKIVGELDREITSMNVTIDKIVAKDQKRNLKVLEGKRDKAKIALEEAVKFNQEEIEAYRTKSKMNAEKVIAENKAKTDVANLKLEEFRKETDSTVKAMMKQILSIKIYDEGEFRSERAASKSVKDRYKRNLKQNLALESEIKRIFKHLKVAKQLFNINGAELIKINVFQNKRIVKLLTLMKIFETLEEVGLNKGHVYGYPHEFSGGMRQRVGIARAIISNPKIIIADEPIAALDLSIQAQIVNLLSDLKKKRGLSVIFIAHDLAMVEFNSDDILIMHLGKLVETGKAEEVFTKPVHPYTRNLIGSMPSLNTINEGFKENNFIPTYLNAYNVANQPTQHEVKKDHYVLADEEQFKEWRRRK